jgi:hypothetical protein
MSADVKLEWEELVRIYGFRYTEIGNEYKCKCVV